MCLEPLGKNVARPVATNCGARRVHRGGRLDVMERPEARVRAKEPIELGARDRVLVEHGPPDPAPGASMTASGGGIDRALDGVREHVGPLGYEAAVLANSDCHIYPHYYVHGHSTVLIFLAIYGQIFMDK